MAAPAAAPSGVTRFRRSWLTSLESVVRSSAAPLLILITPFVAFLKHHDYSYARPEVIVCLTALAAMGLALGAIASQRVELEVLILAAVVTWFVDIQFDVDLARAGMGQATTLAASLVVIGFALWLLRAHAARIMTLVAATSLVSTLLLPRMEAARTATAMVGGRADLPLVVHLILDEHIGVEGVAEDGAVSSLRSEVRSFYQAHRFRVFGRAYSEYAKTERSLGHLFNFSPGQYISDLVQPGGSGFSLRLKRNAYFQRMTGRGYQLHIYQSDWLDLCSDQRPVVCDTYASSGVGILQRVPLRFTQRALILSGAYLSRSLVVNRLTARYPSIRSALSSVGVRLPRWDWSSNTAPLNSAEEAKRLTRQLAQATRGDLFFAHLLIPHSPYVYDGACNLKPLEDWLPREDVAAPSDLANTAEGRATRYPLYAQQVRCSMRIVRDIIEAMPDALRKDAVVIIQGDHGSRLSLVDAGSARAADMSTADYRDNYSTLFAVRSPEIEASYDTRFTPITCILKSLVDGELLSVAGLEACSPTRVVFMRDGGAIVPKPLPAIMGHDE